MCYHERPESRTLNSRGVSCTKPPVSTMQDPSIVHANHTSALRMGPDNVPGRHWAQQQMEPEQSHNPCCLVLQRHSYC